MDKKIRKCFTEMGEFDPEFQLFDIEETIGNLKALIDSYGREARIEELQEINLLVNEFDFKKIDRGIKAYNPAFRDFRMGFVIAKGFIQKTIANRIAVLTAEKSKDE